MIAPQTVMDRTAEDSKCSVDTRNTPVPAKSCICRNYRGMKGQEEERMKGMEEKGNRNRRGIE